MPGFEAKKNMLHLVFRGWLQYPEFLAISGKEKYRKTPNCKTMENIRNKWYPNHAQPICLTPWAKSSSIPLSLSLLLSISAYMHLCLSVPTKYMNIITLLVWNFKTGRTQHIVLALIWTHRKTSIRIFYSGKTAINVNSHARDHWIKSGNTCLLSPRLACCKYITTSISRMRESPSTFH